MTCLNERTHATVSTSHLSTGPESQRLELCSWTTLVWTGIIGWFSINYAEHPHDGLTFPV